MGGSIVLLSLIILFLKIITICFTTLFSSPVGHSTVLLSFIPIILYYSLSFLFFIILQVNGKEYISTTCLDRKFFGLIKTEQDGRYLIKTDSCLKFEDKVTRDALQIKWAIVVERRNFLKTSAA